jgi:hypothetical protein
VEGTKQKNSQRGSEVQPPPLQLCVTKLQNGYEFNNVVEQYTIVAFKQVNVDINRRVQ